MKWATPSKSIDEIHWLLPVNLTWYSCNNLLDIEDDLEDFYICLPVTSQLTSCECNLSKGTNSTFEVISNSFFPCSIPLYVVSANTAIWRQKGIVHLETSRYAR